MDHLLQKKIFWLVPSVSLNQASVRLRCLHIANGLNKNHQYYNLISSDINEVKNSIEPDSFLFVIKMPNPNMLGLLLKAKALNCKIILDITDSVCDISYKNNDYGVNNWILNSLIEIVTAIFVPTAKMRDHLLKHADVSKRAIWGKRVYILPDIAETLEDTRNICDYMIKTFGDKIAQDSLNEITNLCQSTKRQNKNKCILWFGNAYSPTSNMGISSLIPLLPVIKRLQDKQAFILLICTNKNADLSALESWNIRYELIEWSLPEIFRQLISANMTLITTGDDERCQGKSNNRVLLSLVNNCPAVVIGHPNNSEFDMTVERSLKSAISKYIFSKNSEAERVKALSQSQPILNRYMLNEVIKLYNLILQNINIGSILANCDYLYPAENEDEASIICDDLSKDNIAKVLALLKRKYPSCRVNFVNFLTPSESCIEYYSENQIIPYLLKLDEINKSRNLFKNNICIVAGDNLNTKIYDKIVEYLLHWDRFEYTSNRPKIKVVKQALLKEFLGENIRGIQSSKIDCFTNKTPESVSGKNLPSDYNSIEVDILFICGIEAKNWILDGIAKEIGSRSQKSWSIFYCDKKPTHLPAAKNYFFMHQALLKKFVKLKLIDLSNGQNVNCWYTHPRDEDKKSIDDFLMIFCKINKIIFACSENYDLWISRGLNKENGCIVLGGFDSDIFLPHDRRFSHAIGVCSSFYERKNPELLFELVTIMRDKKFILLGKNWESYARYEALIGLGNLEYVTVKYNEYPTYYNRFKVFLSTSRLEGGPIPLIEAMACNCFPVVSKTGFAKDIIDHGSNGFLFETTSSAQKVSKLVKTAYTMDDVNITSSVRNYNWHNFSKNILEAIDK